MKNKTRLFAILAVTFFLGVFTNALLNEDSPGIISSAQAQTQPSKSARMKLGAFSVSLNVKDLQASKAFYENLGFATFAGGPNQKYYIMKNGNALIGIFHGMFQESMLTFNPGWDENANNLAQFDDVRAIQSHLKKAGIPLTIEADSSTSGPAVSC